MTIASAVKLAVTVAHAWYIPFLLAAMAIYRKTADDAEQMPFDRKNLYKEYDFIIIGEI